jgi:hypothetical protein
MGCQIIFQPAVFGADATLIALAVASKIKKGAIMQLPLELTVLTDIWNIRQTGLKDSKTVLHLKIILFL